MLIINPGTEKQKNTTEANAIESAKAFAKELEIQRLKLSRSKEADDDRGFYGFCLSLGERKVTLDIPGVDSKAFLKSEPLTSPRCYVDGSSWLFGYGVGIAEEQLLSE